jgi:hypothetical protein
VWQNRPHDGLRDPAHPGRAFTRNEKYAALVETAGYVPVPLSGDDYIELLPATWRAINAYGVKLNQRTYDAGALDPLRHQDSGVAAHNGRWEIHYDPYSVSTVWLRDHHRAGWITLQWKQLHRVGFPFGELAWDHTRRGLPEATEEELADAVSALLTRAHHGPGHPTGNGGDGEPLSKRDRWVAARTTAAPAATSGLDVPPAPAAAKQPASDDDVAAAGNAAAGDRPDSDDGQVAEVIPMPIFDPFAEADKRW